MADHADIDHTGLTGVSSSGDISTAVSAHTSDATDAHDASAVSFDATGLAHTSATEVQTALENLDTAITSATGGGIASARSKRTSGSVTVNSTTWADFDTGMDLTIAAVAGDVLAVSLTGRWSATGANEGYLDVASIVSAAPVNYVSGGGGVGDKGVQGWMALASVGEPFGGMVQYVVVSGDISGGNVVLRVRYRTSTASNKSVFGTTAEPLHFSVMNLG